MAWRNITRIPFSRGDGYAVTGNLVAGEEVVRAMATTFEASEGEPLPERLVRALEAGQAVGGDKRGKQSAAVTTVKESTLPLRRPAGRRASGPRSRATADLRGGDKAQMLPFIEALPTRRNPKGDLGEEIRGALIPE